MTASRILRRKCIGEDVKNAQQLLIRAGYGELLGAHQDDAVFGIDTKHAVEQFQRDHHLTDDGVIGPLTFTALEAAASQKTVSKLPAETVKKLEVIKTSVHHQHHKKTTSEPSMKHDESEPTHPRVMTIGEVRLAQSYLRVMDYFGPMDDVPGITVVHGILNDATRHAFDRFAKEHGKTYNLASGSPTVDLLNAISKEQENFEQNKHLAAPSNTSNGALEIQRSSLTRAFNEQKTSFSNHFTKVESLHPVMRFTVMKAIQELESNHIHVAIREGYREPHEQIKHVMDGNSTAPPGYSLP